MAVAARVRSECSSMIVIVPDSFTRSTMHNIRRSAQHSSARASGLVRTAFGSLLLIAAALFSSKASAQFRVEISGVGATQLPIAITKFRDEERATPSLSISAIVRADLERSGVFKNVDAPGALDENSAPVFADWRSRAADALAAGSVSR